MKPQETNHGKKIQKIEISTASLGSDLKNSLDSDT